MANTASYQKKTALKDKGARRTGETFWGTLVAPLRTGKPLPGKSPTKLGLSLIALSCVLTMGTQPVNPPKYVARTATLTPAPISQTPVEPVVKTEVVKDVPAPIEPPITAKTPQIAGGSGYMMSGSNCVVCVRAMTGRGQTGNAGTWRASSSTPSIGAVMIFAPGEQGAGGVGHVAVVRGINPDGSISVAHCNWGSGQTTFRTTGKFW